MVSVREVGSGMGRSTFWKLRLQDDSISMIPFSLRIMAFFPASIFSFMRSILRSPAQMPTTSRSVFLETLVQIRAPSSSRRSQSSSRSVQV